MRIITFLMILLTLLSMVQWNKSKEQHYSLKSKNYLRILKNTFDHALSNSSENTTTTSGSIENQSSRQSNKNSREIQKCPGNNCVKDENYPREQVSHFFNSSNFLKFSSFFGHDSTDSLKTRIDDTSHSFCKSIIHYEDPTEAFNVLGELRYIVQGDFPGQKQGYYAEACSNVDGSCEFSDNLPLNINRTCKQMFVYQKMVVVVNSTSDPKASGFTEFYLDNFKIKYCCMCMTHKINEELKEKQSIFTRSSLSKELNVNLN